jgi:hypothetical protein
MKMEADDSFERAVIFHNSSWYHMSEGTVLDSQTPILSLHGDYKRSKREYINDGLQVPTISGVGRLTVL